MFSLSIEPASPIYGVEKLPGPQTSNSNDNNTSPRVNKNNNVANSDITDTTAISNPTRPKKPSADDDGQSKATDPVLNHDSDCNNVRSSESADPCLSRNATPEVNDTNSKLRSLETEQKPYDHSHKKQCS